MVSFLLHRNSLFFFLLLLATPGFSQSPAELKAAADTGNADAMVKLSEAYSFGLGLTQNEDSSRYWVQKAADMGNADGLYILGVKKCTQVYDAKSFTAGIKLLKQAAEQDHAEANARLSEIYQRGKQENETDKYYSYKKAFEYAQKAADLGHESSCLYAARGFARGRGTSKNDSLANHYYEIAANTHHNPNAQILLGERYFQGKTREGKDLWKAYEYYQAAYTNPRSNIDVRTDADLHIHEVDQLLKTTHNLIIQSSGLFPHGIFEYRLREL